MSFSVAGARDSARCQKLAKSEGFVAQPPLNYTTLHYITLHSTTLHSVTLHCTALHYTNYNDNYSYSYDYITLRYTTLH